MTGRSFHFFASDAVGMGLVLHDEQGRVIDANEAAANILELSHDSLTGSHADSPYWRLDGAAPVSVGTKAHPPLPETHTNGDVVSVRTRSGNLRRLKVGIAPWQCAGSVRLAVSFVDLTADWLDGSHAASANEVLSDTWHHLLAYKATLDQHAMVVVIDPAGRITYVNELFCRVSGFASDELIGQTPALFNSAHHLQSFFVGIWAAISRGGTWQGQICSRRKTGETFWLETTIAPLKDPTGHIGGYISINRDITDRKQAESAFEQANKSRREAERLLRHVVKLQTDRETLTGPRSRSVFFERFETILQPRRSKQMATGAIAVIDLNQLKDINAAFGHDAGDEILHVLGRRLDEGVRATDTVARLGSDEFAVILPRIRTEMAVQRLIGRLASDLGRPLVVNAHEIYPEFSVGVAFYPRDGHTPGELVRHAYTALHQAKASEYESIGFFSAALKSQLEHHQEIVDALRVAVQRDEIDIALQPQIVLATGKVAGFEALARWQWQGRNVPPQEFIAIAEENGLIAALGRNVLNKALAALNTILREGHEPGRMAVNVAAAQLKRPDFAKTLKEALERYETPPRRLEIEITENVLLERSAHLVAATLQSLHELGVSVALDDFGTGYASLAHLKSYPVDRLKIDRSFVSGIPKDADDTVIVRTVIGLAHNLSMDVVAEGIETADQLSNLADQRCDVGQGYHFGRPASLEQTLAFLAGLTCKRQKAG